MKTTKTGDYILNGRFFLTFQEAEQYAKYTLGGFISSTSKCRGKIVCDFTAFEQPEEGRFYAEPHLCQ